MKKLEGRQQEQRDFVTGKEYIVFSNNRSIYIIIGKDIMSFHGDGEGVVVSENPSVGWFTY